MTKIITAITALSLALLAGCAFNGEKPDGSGTIECTQVEIAAQVAARIITLTPQEGDYVRQGDIIARLDSADYDLKGNEARATVAVARSQLELLLAGSREEDIERARDQVMEARAMAESI